MHKHIEELRKRLRSDFTRYGTISATAQALRVSPALIWKVLYENVDSPTLRRRYGITKTNRCRLCIEADKELIARYDELRGEISRRDFLKDILHFWETA